MCESLPSESRPIREADGGRSAMVGGSQARQVSFVTQVRE
jgi:hypothetical protein